METLSYPSGLPPGDLDFPVPRPAAHPTFSRVSRAVAQPLVDGVGFEQVLAENTGPGLHHDCSPGIWCLIPFA